MSAVSSGSPQSSAEVRQPVASREPGPNHQPASAPQQGAGHDPGADFGANEWLVEELYQRYLADPGSVDRAWWSFFADYQPALANGTGPQPVISVARAAASAAPAAPAAPPAPPAPPQPQVAPRPQPGPQQPQAAAPAQAAPVAPAPQAAPAAAPAPAPGPAAPPPVPGAEVSRLRGAAARTVTNMTASL